VAALELVSGQALIYRGTQGFITASIVKVDILIALLLAAQKDGRSLTRSEKSLARSMITRSDDEAASALWRAVGGALGLNRVKARLGLTDTSAGTGGCRGRTRTTASDQFRLLRVLVGPTGPLTEARRS
jgi:alkanesulfonate monooxygenase SsuD/methylene tetrahydromethanopterin reductase-like flavin-dependent oxidoreductase (luciferase family)